MAEGSSKNGKKEAEPERVRSPKNKTITLSKDEIKTYRNRLLSLEQLKKSRTPTGTFNGDFRELVKHVPEGIVSLLILDPPYNLSKDFKSSRFLRRSVVEYESWLDEVLELLKPCLKDDATIYICGEWYSSVSIYAAAAKHFQVRNRICWEREKGRGASCNWKNASEDIWFCTVSDTYTFNVEDVKLRRKVIAPYRNEKGIPKDWSDTADGAYRDTHPSNIWTDISVPFWSMPENTEHPTQKSEKLLAKLILASSNPGDLVMDPFLGSGSSSVVAKKLGRKYLGCDIDETYCLLAEKRLELAQADKRIQGFADSVFWERNTLAEQQQITRKDPDS